MTFIVRKADTPKRMNSRRLSAAAPTSSGAAAR